MASSVSRYCPASGYLRLVLGQWCPAAVHHHQRLERFISTARGEHHWAGVRKQPQHFPGWSFACLCCRLGGTGLNIGIVTGSVYTSESSSPLGPRGTKLLSPISTWAASS